MANSKNLQLQRGQRIKARVEEVLGGDALIVGYQGNLVRILNSTGTKNEVGDILDLQVVGLQPLEFRFFHNFNGFNRVV